MLKNLAAPTFKFPAFNLFGQHYTCCGDLLFSLLIFGGVCFFSILLSFWFCLTRKGQRKWWLTFGQFKKKVSHGPYLKKLLLHLPKSNIANALDCYRWIKQEEFASNWKTYSSWFIGSSSKILYLKNSDRLVDTAVKQIISMNGKFCVIMTYIPGIHTYLSYIHTYLFKLIYTNDIHKFEKGVLRLTLSQKGQIFKLFF